MTDSIIQGVTDYFMACPLLKDGAFRVNSLGDTPIEYAIETGIGNPVLRTYLDGSSVRQYKFNFSSREYFSLDRAESIANSEFYERLADWIEKQSADGVLPDMPEGCQAESMEVDAPGYSFDATMTRAKYTIQLTLNYFKEAN